MTRLLLAMFLLTGTPLNAQSPEVLVEALKFARAELTRQHVAPDEVVVFDTLVALPPATKRGVFTSWSTAHLEEVETSTDMQLGSMKAVRKCTTLRSGEVSCTLRPTRAVVAAAQPQINGDTATVLVLLRFQPREPTFSPTTKEPFEIHFSQTINVRLARRSNGWTVTGHTMGPPGVSVGW